MAALHPNAYIRRILVEKFHPNDYLRHYFKNMEVVYPKNDKTYCLYKSNKEIIIEYNFIYNHVFVSNDFYVQFGIIFKEKFKFLYFYEKQLIVEKTLRKHLKIKKTDDVIIANLNIINFKKESHEKQNQLY